MVAHMIAGVLLGFLVGFGTAVALLKLYGK